MQAALPRGIVAALAVAETIVAGFFYFRPDLVFGMLGRPVLDPVISRQYGLFLASVALFYALLSTNPARYGRLLWIGVAQRVAELAAAVLDWRAGALAGNSFACIALIEVIAGAALTFYAARMGAIGSDDPPQYRVDVWLRRALLAFGGLQVFWAFLSTIFVQLGARLLGWKLQDAYTTQQQGIALLVIGLTSLLAAADVNRYRRFVWIAVSSQAFGVANAVNELRLGTITPTVALIQWAIEASIIATLLSLASIEHGESEVRFHRSRPRAIESSAD